MKLTVEQALDILEITGEKRTEILEQLNEKSDVNIIRSCAGNLNRAAWCEKNTIMNIYKI